MNRVSSFACRHGNGKHICHEDTPVTGVPGLTGIRRVTGVTGVTRVTGVTGATLASGKTGLKAIIKIIEVPGLIGVTEIG